MKKHAFALVISSLLASSAFAAPMQISFTGGEAKQAYNTLAAQGIQGEGAAGHWYLTGKQISCSYAGVDIDGPDGKPVPQGDVSRYECRVQMSLGAGGTVQVYDFGP